MNRILAILNKLYRDMFLHMFFIILTHNDNWGEEKNKKQNNYRICIF